MCDQCEFTTYEKFLLKRHIEMEHQEKQIFTLIMTTTRARHPPTYLVEDTNQNLWIL